MSLIVVSVMVVSRKDGCQTPQIVEPENDDPGLAVLPMTDDGEFRLTGVLRRLVERIVKSKSLRSLAFEMDVRNIRNDIRTIGRSLELDTAPGGDTKDTHQLGGQFPLASFTF